MTEQAYDEFVERLIAVFAAFPDFPGWFMSLSEEDRADLKSELAEEIDDFLTIDARPVDTSPEAQAALLERVERVCEEVKDAHRKHFGLPQEQEEDKG